MVRPFIPCWGIQQTNFEEISSYYDTLGKREGPYKHKDSFSRLVDTWVVDYPYDKKWFDKPEVYAALKNDIVCRIGSEKMVTDNNLNSKNILN